LCDVLKQLLLAAVSDIDYDLELHFLKSEEELEQERKAKEAKEEQERRAKEEEERRAKEPNTPPVTPPIQTPPPGANNKAPPPMVDRSRKPNNLNNNDTTDKNLYDATRADSKSKVCVIRALQSLFEPPIRWAVDTCPKEIFT
jgi:type IV secretory pathway VirB10-like protein